jgi:hypothetical protein
LINHGGNSINAVLIGPNMIPGLARFLGLARKKLGNVKETSEA